MAVVHPQEPQEPGAKKTRDLSPARSAAGDQQHHQIGDGNQVGWFVCLCSKTVAHSVAKTGSFAISS